MSSAKQDEAKDLSNGVQYAMNVLGFSVIDSAFSIEMDTYLQRNDPEDKRKKSFAHYAKDTAKLFEVFSSPEGQVLLAETLKKIPRPV